MHATWIRYLLAVALTGVLMWSGWPHVGSVLPAFAYRAADSPSAFEKVSVSHTASVPAGATPEATLYTRIVPEQNGDPVADATRQLVSATDLLFIATLLLFIAAVAVPYISDRMETTRRESRHRVANNYAQFQLIQILRMFEFATSIRAGSIDQSNILLVQMLQVYLSRALEHDIVRSITPDQARVVYGALRFAQMNFITMADHFNTKESYYREYQPALVEIDNQYTAVAESGSPKQIERARSLRKAVTDEHDQFAVKYEEAEKDISRGIKQSALLLKSARELLGDRGAPDVELPTEA